MTDIYALLPHPVNLSMRVYPGRKAVANQDFCMIVNFTQIKTNELESRNKKQAENKLVEK